MLRAILQGKKGKGEIQKKHRTNNGRENGKIVTLNKNGNI